jgi:hypothetical protein
MLKPMRLTLLLPRALIVYVSLVVAVFGVAVTDLPVCPSPPEPAQWDGRTVLLFYRDVETCRIFTETLYYSDATGYSFSWREDAPDTLQMLVDRGARIGFLDRWLAGEKMSVQEYFNTILAHYFLASGDEQRAIERREAGPGWIATGQGFTARTPWIADLIGDVPLSVHVERFYGSVWPGPNSHFFTIDPLEARNLHERFGATPSSEPRWRSEGYRFNAFPLRPDGMCDAHRQPVWRAFNDGPARGLESNHRYGTDHDLIAGMASAGWIVEGIVFCVDDER